ncbi:MAG: peptidase, partial [Candidatus Saccharibacteria bacterium]|nr:peptidase [Candidatus Saccharibacteria bacterium]
MLRSGVNVAILLAIFVVGVNVGNGRIDLQHHRSVSSNLPSKLDYNEVDQVYQSLKENYDGKLSADQLEEGLKHGLATSTKDPYTTYFTAKEAKAFSDQLNNSFSGIGAQLGQDTDGNLEVIAPIANLPADKAGVKAKDIISNINDETTSGMSVDDAVSKIRGKAGTSVTLKIVR